ncbi:Short-chain dehydrogenase TIC 32 [Colletotrichum sp. SAR 10_77]|nr:Short-chain dehydrogenase TIC 32 [Colletotrichum sp. SAR 10_77]
MLSLSKTVTLALPTNLDCTKPATHKSTHTGEKGTFEVLCGCDYGGGNYNGIDAPTFEACVKACDAEEACIAVAYVSDQQDCYLKDVQTPATALAWVNYARKISKASGVTCAGGASNGANGNFEIVCAVDYAGADIAALQVASFEDCIKACDNDARCLDVSYSHSGKTCWTKDRLTIPNPFEAIWTAKKVDKEKPTSQVTCVGNTADGTTYKATKSSFQILCGVDYRGEDIGAAQLVVLGTSYPYVRDNYWGEVYMKPMDQAFNGYTLAKCAKDSDPYSKGLTCSIIDAGGVERFGISLQVPDFQANSYYRHDGRSSNHSRPAWYKLPDTSWYKWLPFTMTYEDGPRPS